MLLLYLQCNARVMHGMLLYFVLKNIASFFHFSLLPCCWRKVQRGEKVRVRFRRAAYRQHRPRRHPHGFAPHREPTQPAATGHPTRGTAFQGAQALLKMRKNTSVPQKDMGAWRQ